MEIKILIFFLSTYSSLIILVLPFLFSVDQRATKNSFNIILINVSSKSLKKSPPCNKFISSRHDILPLASKIFVYML